MNKSISDMSKRWLFVLLSVFAGGLYAAEVQDALPGQAVAEDLGKTTPKGYVTPANLRYPYVAPYYVKPTVLSGGRVTVRFYVTDWAQREIQQKAKDARFDVTVKCVDAADKAVVKSVKGVPAGDGEISFDGLADGDWHYALSAVDLKSKLPSHVVWGRFRIVPKDFLAIPADKAYRMTEADLASYGIRNDGDYERVVLVPGATNACFRTGRQDLVKPGTALIDAYLKEHPHQDAKGRPGYAAYVPGVDGQPCAGAYRVVRIVRDAGYDTNAVAQIAAANSAGLQRFLDEKAAAGFRKVVFLPGTYRVKAGVALKMVSNLTVDLGGATLKENGFTGAHALMVDFPAVKDAILTNGTLEGDYFEHDYAGSPDKSEWPMGFHFSSICEHCAVHKVVVKNITGYGGGCSYGSEGPGKWLSHADERTTNKYGMNFDYMSKNLGWDKGGLRADGTVDPDAEGLITCKPLSLYRYERFGWLQLSRKLGRGWIGARGWNFIFGYYDADGKCLGTEVASHYRLTKIPAGAKKVRVSIELKDVDDLEGRQLMLAYMKIPVNCSIVGCTFDRCRAVGFAMGPCRNFLLKDNLFTHSGETLAKCAFDAEDGADFSQDITFVGNVFRDNPNNEMLTCKGINFVFERNTCSFSFYPRTYSYCVRDNDVTGASFGCGEQTLTGYCRIEGNRYKGGNLVLGGKGQSPKGWNVVLDGETFTPERNGKTFAAGSSGNGLFRNCTFDRVGCAVGHAEKCTFTKTWGQYMGTGMNGEWTDCVATDGAKAQQFSDNVYRNCRFNNFGLGCSMGSQTLVGCTLENMKLGGGANGKFKGTLEKCTFVGPKSVPGCWKTLE